MDKLQLVKEINDLKKQRLVQNRKIRELETENKILKEDTGSLEQRLFAYMEFIEDYFDDDDDEYLEITHKIDKILMEQE